jgi:signal transduction histidine kinase
MSFSFRNPNGHIHTTTELKAVPGYAENPPSGRARWWVRLERASDPSRGIDLRLTDEVILGAEDGEVGIVSLNDFDARERGVSRRHVRLWPTETGLFVLDVGSTNGTRLNGCRLEPNTPHNFVDGDELSLGSLNLIVRIIEESESQAAYRSRRADLASALTQLAKAITSRLDLDEVLAQALDMAMSLTSAGEMAIWLVDEATGELFLEAERGVTDEQVRRMRLKVADPLLNRVIASGRPLRARRQPDGDPLKVKTGYVVEALLYVPLVTEGHVLGVMSAVHRDADMAFSARDEHLLAAIADFAAIALHNTRLYTSVQHADQVKGEMIQNISHEYRTPLHIIMGYVSLLHDEADQLSPDLAEMLHTIATQAERLNWLTDNIIWLQMVDERALYRRPHPLVTLLARSVEEAGPMAGERRIALTFESTGESPVALVDEEAIRRIMSNLLSNAIKFTPPGGRVAVCIEPPEAGNAGDVVTVSVADTGIGISPEAHDRIFERFFQLDGSSQRKYGGVGLGLPVVKALVEAHGGAIRVASMPGEGSTFSFTLPLADPPPGE